MNRYIFHPLKWSKSFLVRPIKTINWIKEDIRKDLSFKNLIHLIIRFGVLDFQSPEPL